MHAPSPPLSLLALAALCAACGGSEAAQQAQEANLFTVRRGELPITVRENAELQALRETIVRSDVEGQATIISIVAEGTMVAQDQPLVTLDVSELVEKRANQAISVSKAEAALTQARKEKQILQKELSTKRNTAESNLIIAEMELEKLLGRKAGSGSEGKNGDMIQRLQALVSMSPEKPPAVATETADGPPPSPMPTVDPRSYGSLVNKVYDLLVMFEPNADGTPAPKATPEQLAAARQAAAARDMGDMANKILQQADTIKLAMGDLKFKEDTYGYSWRLAKKSFITNNELQKDELAYQSAMSKVSLAWNDLDLLVNYTLARERIKLTQDRDNASLELARVIGSNEAAVIKADSDLQSREAEYELAKERLDNLDRQIKSAEIRAPTPGTVVYARIDRNRGGGEAVREGVQVRERQELIILPDTTKMRCVIKVQEAQVDKVAKGQHAVVTVEAFQGETFTGRVTSVAPVADSNSGWMTSDRKVYTTVVELDSDNPDGRLRSRMAANVTIMIDTVKDTLPIPLQAVQRDRAVNFVWMRTPDGQKKPVAIKVGRQNSERVEVLDGLAAGDVIWLTPPPGEQPPKFEQPVAPPAAPAKTDTATPAATGAAVAGEAAAGDGQRPNRRPGGARTMKKFADMTPEELEQAKAGLDRYQGMIDMARSSAGEEKALEMETTVSALRKALEANDLPTAQSYQDKLRAAMRAMMPAGGRNGGGGGPGGGGAAPGGGGDNGGNRAERGN